MALTTVQNICQICGKKLEEGPAIYITKVKLTRSGRSSPSDGMSYGGSWRKTPKDKLRIQHLGSSKPKFCVHQECYEEKIEKLISEKKK